MIDYPEIDSPEIDRPDIKRPVIEYPEHISNLSRDYYDGKISAELYRQERRRIINQMDHDFNGGDVG